MLLTAISGAIGSAAYLLSFLPLSDRNYETIR
jgi:hypothetical protein